MKNILICMTAALLICSFNSQAKKKSIFNGKDLTGWTIFGTEKWYVDNGNLVCESGPDKKYGYLLTNDTHKDFDLTVEFLQESNGNSGIFFRSTCVGTKISGWQCEVAPKDHDSGGIYESYVLGWLKTIENEKEKMLKPGDMTKIGL